MITFITGVPGSGKTYKAMYALFSNFAKDKKIIKDKKYQVKGIKRALTNINEIDLTKFNNVSSIDWEDFYDKLTALYTMSKEKVDDTELKKLASQFEILDTFIILDECHNYLDGQDKVLVWWLSYHRHLHQEIYLITQNLTLVGLKYKAFSEFFYKAYPSSLKLLNNSMKYGQYSSSRMTNNTKSGNIKIPIVKEVFDSYGSGNNQQSKSLIMKFLLLTISFFIIGGSILYIIKKSMSNESLIDNKETHIVDTYIENDKSKTSDKLNNDSITSDNDESFNDDILDYKFMSLKCNIKHGYCLYNNKKIQINTYYKLKKIFSIEELSVTPINNSFTQLDILANTKFYNIFHGGQDNEKDNNNSLSIFPNSN